MSNTSERVSQLSPVKRALLALEEMQGKLDAVERAKTEPIAIVGMGCRFPGGAVSPQAFWRLLSDGVDAVTEVPAGRWDVDAYFDPNPETPGKMYSRRGAFLEDVDQFDAGFFKISPREARALDPQQRLLLETTWEALESAGQTLDKLAGSRTGVFVGLMNNEYFQQIRQNGVEAIDAYFGTGNVASSAAGRLSYVLGLNGPSMTIDTACSASLVAVHLACQSLRQGESNLALAGGVNLLLLPDTSIYLSKARTLAADGHCKTFDAAANGYVRGEGCGVVALKRLSDAVADGDNILALIRGSAVSHDGHSSGFTVPSGGAQRKVIRKALANAGVEPAEVTYVEAHGTGTPLGDPIEIRALGEVLGGESRQRPWAVGSVKTNIGHLEAAAGIAGLIKVVLAMQHRQLPPHLHLKHVNPQISLGEAQATIPTELTEWPGVDGRPRVAGVSSFGLTGTIAHAVLEEAPQIPASPGQVEDERAQHLLPLSARSRGALESLARAYQQYLGGGAAAHSLTDVCHTASVRRAHHDHRLAVVGRTRQELAERLGNFLRGESLPSATSGEKRGGGTPRVVFVFPGQGSQWHGMGRQLLAREPVFRAAIERCAEEMSKHVGWSLLEEINADPSRSRLDEIDVVQPTLFAIQVALTALWRSWGVEPDAVVGQSMGEVAAAHAAGALSLEDAVRIICRRSKLLKRLSGEGSMAAVELSLEQSEAALRGYEGRLSVAVSNSPTSTVIAGEAEALEELLDGLRQRGVFCRQIKVDIASHSPQMEPLHDDLLEALDGLQPRSPRVPICSTVTGAWGNDLSYDARYWWRNLREPVLFSSAVSRLLEDGYETFLEVSPHPIVLSAVQQGMYHLGKVGSVLPSLRREEDEQAVMLSSAGSLYASGHGVNWSAIYPRRHSAPALPSYPWQRERFWVEPRSTKTRGGSRRPQATGDGVETALLGSHCAPAHSPLAHVWERELDVSSFPYLSDHRVQGLVVLPGTFYVEMVLAAAAEIFGGRFGSLAGVEFRRPLFLTEEAGRTLQLTFSSEEAGEVAFNVFSRDEEDAGDQPSWTLHASGRVVLGGGAFAATPAPHVSLAEAQGRCPVELAGEDFYALLEEKGNQYGASFRGLETLRRGAGEAVARLHFPQAQSAEFDAHGFHPALLDNCLQLIAATVGDVGAETSAYVPVGVEEVRVYGRPTQALWSYARLRADEARDGLTGDALLLDEDGRVLVEFRGVRLQPLDGQQDAVNPNDWLYELRWQEQERGARATGGERARQEGQGRWLIFADRQGVGASLAAQLEEAGEPCFRVLAGDSFARTDEASFSARPGCAEDMRRLFEQTGGAGGFDCRGVVHLWNLDSPPAAQLTTGALRESQLAGCVSVLQLTQELGRVEWRTKPRVWLVTGGAQAVAPGGSQMALAQSPVWGLGRTIAQELPEFFGGLIDVDVRSGAAQTAALLKAEVAEPDAESQIAFRQGRRFVCRLAAVRRSDKPDSPPAWRPDGSYLITGGMGGLGLEVARWMAAQGARRIILLGRAPLPPRSEWDSIDAESPLGRRVAAIRRLEASGVSVHLAAADVSDERQLRAFLEDFEREGWPRIRGVVHAAGSLRDKTLLQMDAEAFDATWGSKVVGSWLLHELLQNHALDFFILFSSASSLLGSPGQANYAAANSFMDALAHQRRAEGLPALSINWGAWSEVGLAAEVGRGGRLATRGFGSIAPKDGLEVLSKLVRRNLTQVGVLPIDWSAVRRFAPAIADASLFSEVAGAAQDDGRSQGGAPVKAGVTRDLLAAAGPEERRALLESYLRELAAKVLGIAPSAFDPQKPLNRLGLDSLMAIELKNAIESNLAVTLSMVSIIQGPTTEQLASQVLALLDEQLSSSRPPGQAESSSAEAESLTAQEAEQLLSRLDELTPEQIDQLLAKASIEA